MSRPVTAISFYLRRSDGSPYGGWYPFVRVADGRDRMFKESWVGGTDKGAVMLQCFPYDRLRDETRPIGTVTWPDGEEYNVYVTDRHFWN